MDSSYYSITPPTHRLLRHSYSFNVVYSTTISPPPLVCHDKDQTAAAAFHDSLLLVVAILIAFLQLKYQGSVGNPFLAHPVTMGVALWSTVLYFIASSRQISFPVGRRARRHCMVWSGNVLVASLASLFAPDSAWPLFYGLALFSSAGTELLVRMYPNTYYGRKMVLPM